MEENVAINRKYKIKEELSVPEALVNISGDVNEPEFDVEIKRKPCFDAKSEAINESLTQVMKSDELIEDRKLEMPLHEEIFIKDELNVFGAEAEDKPIAYLNSESINDGTENMYEPPIDAKEIKEEVDEISQFEEFDDNNVELISPPVSKIETGDEIVTSESIEKPFQCIFCKMPFSNQERMVKHIKERWCNKKIFECPKCYKTFAHKYNSKIHIKNCIKCESCQKQFSDMDLFKKHLTTHEKNYFECEICQKIYTSRPHFTLHKKTHTYEVAYECNQCKMRFNSVKLIELHMKTHTEGNSEQNATENLECEICKRKFVRKHTFEQHMMVHNSKQPLHSCDICQKIYLYDSQLRQHMKSHPVNKLVDPKVQSKSLVSENFYKRYFASTDQKKFQCKVCLRKFLHKNTLNLHMTSHSEVDPSFECDICKEKFYRRFNLDLHLQLHKKETTAQCKICLKIFMGKNGLTSHSRIHTAKAPVECAICHKKFALKTYLRQHMIVHKEDRALFECSICHKECKTKAHLQWHITEKHSLKKPRNKLFECKICQKKFSIKRSLITHMHIHKGTLKIQECTKCEKKFRWRYSLYRHNRKMHAEVNKDSS